MSTPRLILTVAWAVVAVVNVIFAASYHNLGAVFGWLSTLMAVIVILLGAIQ